MKQMIWVTFIVLVGAVALVALFAVQGMSRQVGGGTEASRALEDRLRVTFGAVAAEEPALRVFTMMPEAEGKPWKWKVEGTLLAGRTPDDAETARAVKRAVSLCLMSPVGGKDPGGILVVLHAPGKPDWSRSFDDQGRPK